jgi:AraC-like DNA-binding protein
VRVADVACAAPRSSCGAPEHAAAPELILPRRGVFAVHRRRSVAVADAASAIVLRGGEEYRVSHPAGHGDACTALAFAPGLLDEALGERPAGHGTLRPATQRQAALLTARLRRGTTALEAEEGALLLLDAVAGDLRARPSVAPATARRADAVRALVASDPAADWRLASVAAAVHCSPFHLARQFRAATGETIARYVLRLRLAVAAERVAGGERDLAALAHELGFAHHSHLSARFRSFFALAPRDLRKTVTAGAPAAP